MKVLARNISTALLVVSCFEMGGYLSMRPAVSFSSSPFTHGIPPWILISAGAVGLRICECLTQCSRTFNQPYR